MAPAAPVVPVGPVGPVAPLPPFAFWASPTSNVYVPVAGLATDGTRATLYSYTSTLCTIGKAASTTSPSEKVDDGGTRWVRGPGLDWELDWTAPWERLVAQAREWSLLEATEAPVGDDVFVVPEWIDRSDLDRGR